MIRASLAHPFEHRCIRHPACCRRCRRRRSRSAQCVLYDRGGSNISDTSSGGALGFRLPPRIGEFKTESTIRSLSQSTELIKCTHTGSPSDDRDNTKEAGRVRDARQDTRARKSVLHLKFVLMWTIHFMIEIPHDSVYTQPCTTTSTSSPTPFMNSCIGTA